MHAPPRATRTPPLLPRALVPGSRVALVAPAGPVDPDRLEGAAERCRIEGFEPVVFPGASGKVGYLAGTDAERLGDLQVAFDDPSIDAVWPLRGGYGTLRILDELDLRRQLRDPIPFIGFSDNTSIHMRHLALGVVSFHGPHPTGAFPLETEEALRRVVCQPTAAGPLHARGGDPQPRTLVGGRAEAPLVGGNLSILTSMCGTAYALDPAGCILFLEDVAEPTYKLDRMLVQLRRSGATEAIVGLALGRFRQGPDEEEHPVADLLLRFARRLGVPAVADLPFGHVEHNATLPVGTMARLDADGAELVLTEPAVRAS
ncbi:MAG: LD-carboxypeptidase [Gemmatimonadota bacterium]